MDRDTAAVAHVIEHARADVVDAGELPTDRGARPRPARRARRRRRPGRGARAPAPSGGCMPSSRSSASTAAMSHGAIFRRGGSGGTPGSYAPVPTEAGGGCESVGRVRRRTSSADGRCRRTRAVARSTLGRSRHRCSSRNRRALRPLPWPRDLPAPAAPGRSARAANALVFLAAGAVLVLEILGVRLLAPYVGLTLETTTAIIGAALAGIAAGAAAGGFAADRFDGPPAAAAAARRRRAAVHRGGAARAGVRRRRARHRARSPRSPSR